MSEHKLGLGYHIFTVGVKAPANKALAELKCRAENNLGKPFFLFKFDFVVSLWVHVNDLTTNECGDYGNQYA